jgi:hypothetical protein
VASYLIYNKVDNDSVKDIIRAIIAAAIWVPYFKISTRVRETFIVPYPHSNYSYEEWGAVKKTTGENEQEGTAVI